MYDARLGRQWAGIAALTSNSPTVPSTHARRLAAAATAAALLTPLPAIAGSGAGKGGADCVRRTLIVSAMPIELGPIFAKTKVDKTVTADGHDFFVGTLAGHGVVLTLTGIGPVNAGHRTEQALKLFACNGQASFDGIIFSGVAGGDWIGNVTVPIRWTLDKGKTFVPVDPQMLASARKVASDHVPLEQQAPAGDPACGCVVSPRAVGTVSVTHKPTVEVGGNGETTDPFSGRALPCAPGGGDVLGCEPCVLQGDHASQGQQFASGVPPFVDPSFFTGYGASTAPGKGHYVAEDEETAAVATAAARARVPFLGFRAVSDGGGDPLGLPGFPVQFFYYRQLAADNAATVTLAFLAKWHESR